VPAAAVPSSSRASARSLRALLRLFWAAHLAAGVLLAQFGSMLFFVPTPRAYFFMLGFAVSVGVFFASFVLEAMAGPRVAFLRTLALPEGTTRWLQLAPPCAMALVLAAAAAAFGRLPPVTGLVTLGCLWWAIATSRWFFVWFLSLPGDGWTEVVWKIAGGLLLLAAAALAALCAWAAQRAGGWVPAAGVAVAMGLLGLWFTPPAHFPRGSSLSMLRAGSSPPAPPRAVRAARSADRAPSWFSTVRRLGLIDVSPWSMAVLAVMYGEFAIGRTRAAEMQALAANLGLYFGFTLGRAAQQPALLSMLPVSRAQTFVGRMLPWIVVPLVFPALLLVKGEPPLEILRMVLYVLVTLFSLASTLMGPPVGARRLLRAVPGLSTYVVAAATGFGRKLPAQLQSVWVLALLAGGCFAMWARLRRRAR
jgi:hypothetical protein